MTTVATTELRARFARRLSELYGREVPAYTTLVEVSHEVNRRVKLTRSEAWLPRLGEAVERRAPALADVGIAGGWAGLYEMTPDHNALIGRADTVENFLYATGFSGHGFLMGPAVGEIMGELYLGEETFVDVTGLSAARFAGAAVRPELNIV